MHTRNATHNRHRGAAMVEFALALPFLMMLLMGIIEFAMIGHQKLMIVQGARAGARDASIGRPVAEVKATTRAGASTLDLRDDQIAVEFNSQPDGNGTWLPVVDNPLGNYNAVPTGYLVRVRISDWPHTMITGPFFSWLPGVQNNQMPLSGQMIASRE